MAQTDGEKELVLGNKQLISLFFVVVALCGVFFAMGYIIGRNSTKAAMAGLSDSGSPASASAGQRAQPEPPRETAAAQPDTVAAQPSTDPPPAPQDVSPGVATKAAVEPESPATPEPKVSKSSAIAVVTPEAGASYLQVTALGRADADSVIRTLREQNFPAVLAASSKDGLFRVLVGPYHDTASVAEAKSRLKTLGFANAFVQKQ